MTTGLVLRRMRWWDIETVHAIETDVFLDPWSVEAFWSELAHVPETRQYLVAEDQGRIVGYGGLLATGRRSHTADVQTVAVRPATQGAGVGRTLVTALVGEAARRGAAEVLLEVRAENEVAQRLYARLGFERLGVRRGYYQPGGTDAYVLRKRLGRTDRTDVIEDHGGPAAG